MNRDTRTAIEVYCLIGPWILLAIVIVVRLVP